MDHPASLSPSSLELSDTKVYELQILWIIHIRVIQTKSAGDKKGVDTEKEFVIFNLLVRIHFIIVMIRWTGLAPWEFEFPFPGSLTSNFLGGYRHILPLSSEEGTT